MTVLIGTVYKEQKKKPCVFSDITGVISNASVVDLSFGTKGIEGNQDLAGTYIAEDDHVILEDSSGRINIKAGPKFKPDEQVTGTIMALLGISDNQGYFEVQDTCMAGIPFKAELPSGVEIKNRSLFDDNLLQSGARKFVALTSGLNFGDMGDLVECQ